MSETAEANRPTMHAVLVPREKLLATLRENRDKHQATYEEAHAGWERARVEHLRKVLAAAEEGEFVPEHFPGSEPRSYVEDYDTAIAMLDWSEEEYIELSRDEFRQYVLDEWKWKRDWVGSTMGYVGEHGEMPGG